MNLKSKGFFLDNAADIAKFEVRAVNERKIAFENLSRKKTEILSILKQGNESDGN